MSSGLTSAQSRANFKIVLGCSGPADILAIIVFMKIVSRKTSYMLV